MKRLDSNRTVRQLYVNKTIIKTIIREMIHIKADKNSVNHRTDVANLSLI